MDSSAIVPDNVPGENFSDFKEEEYETQYFRFLPRSFTDGMYNAVHDYTHDSLNTLETYLCQQYGGIMEDCEIKLATEAVLKKLTVVMDKYFDKLEVYLKTNVFLIPDNVTLPEDSLHNNYKISQVATNLLDIEINNLKSKITKCKQKKALLKNQLDDQKALKVRIEEFSNQLNHLKTIAHSNGIDNWKDTLTFGVAKADELGTGVASFVQNDESSLK